MDTDTGEIPAEMLKANLTVCMAAVKRGMLRMPAFDHPGELVVADIGLEPDLPEWVKMNRYVIDEEIARNAVPQRPPGAHKGTFGTAFIVAGSHRFPGAALLAGEAAYRSGAGLVTIGTAESIQPSLAGHLREATWLPLPDASGWIAHSAAEIVRAGLDDRVTACLLGPGFGQQKTTQDFLNALLNPELPPLTIDADALKLLSRIDNWQQRLPTDTVLTPHPGEMAILSGLATDEIQNNRTEIAERFSKQWNVVLVLKGAFTVVAAPDGRSATLPLATPALARAGTGDVLAGLICGLRAQGVTAFEAACTAVWLHGQAGLRAAALMGGIAEIPDLIGV
jgi:NAD(P)H-hydrate epimerase